MSTTIYYDLTSCASLLCNALKERRHALVTINHDCILEKPRNKYSWLHRPRRIKFNPSSVDACLVGYHSVINYIQLTIANGTVDTKWFDLVREFGHFILEEQKKHLFKNDQNQLVYSETYMKDDEEYTNVFFNIDNQYHLKFSFYQNHLDSVRSPLVSFLDDSDDDEDVYFCDIEIKHDIGKDIIDKVKWNGKDYIGGFSVDMDMIKIDVSRAIVNSFDSILNNIFWLYTGGIPEAYRSNNFAVANWETNLKDGIRVW